ncbi:MAG: diguanylate cyclase [Pseudohongiellaceae bacterium]
MLPRKLYIVIILLVLMIAGFLAISLSSYFAARDSLSQQLSEQTLPLTGDNIYSEIQRDLLRPILISSLMAGDTFLRDWIIDGEQGLDRVQAYLTEIQREYDTITAFVVSEATRNYYHPSGLLKQVNQDDEEDAWYFRARSLNTPYEINVDWDTADRSRLSIFINYRVLDYAGNYLGIAGVGLSVESVTQLINEYQQRYGRIIYFTDRTGNITLTGNDLARVSEMRLQNRPGLGDLARQVLSNPGLTISYYNADNEEVFLNSRLVPEFNWYLIVEQQGSLGSDRIESALWNNLMVSAAILAMVLVAAWFTLQSYQRRLEEMATTDSLTGIANRHVFEPIINHVIKGTSRKNKAVSLLIFDIDNFKQINDTYGHNSGDLVLKNVAGIIKAHIRETDTVCRWGGEEFMLLLDDCTETEATQRAAAILKAVRAQTMALGKKDTIKVTLSCGVAQHQKGENMEFLVNRVDSALYRAKDKGRDQVCVAG